MQLHVFSLKEVLKVLKWVFDKLLYIFATANGIDLRCFKLWIHLDQILKVSNIKGLQFQVAKIYGGENLRWDKD